MTTDNYMSDGVHDTSKFQSGWLTREIFVLEVVCMRNDISSISDDKHVANVRVRVPSWDHSTVHTSKKYRFWLKKCNEKFWNVNETKHRKAMNESVSLTKQLFEYVCLWMKSNFLHGKVNINIKILVRDNEIDFLKQFFLNHENFDDYYEWISISKKVYKHSKPVFFTKKCIKIRAVNK